MEALILIKFFFYGAVILGGLVLAIMADERRKSS